MIVTREGGNGALTNRNMAPMRQYDIVAMGSKNELPRGDGPRRR